MRIDFSKHQKSLLYLFNSPLRGWLGVPPTFKGKIVKVTGNSVHRVKSVKNGVVEYEMVAMVGQPIFEKQLMKAVNYGLLSSQFIPRLLFPVPRLAMMALTTTNNFGTGSGDGRVGFSNGTWSTVHDATDGSDSDTVLDYIVVQGDRLNAGTYYIYRAFLPADTSAIDDGATITNAVLHIFEYGGSSGAGPINWSAVTTTQASTSSLANADFDAVGGTSLGDVAITYGAAAGTEYTITISSPDTNISKTGFTKIGIREKDHDLANVAATHDYYNQICSSEHATSAYRPYYAVTYTTVLTTTILETSTTTETVTVPRGKVFSLSDTTTLTEVISAVFGRSFSILDTFSITDFISAVFPWIRQTKNTSTISNQSKNSSSWTNNSKNNATITNEVKH